MDARFTIAVTQAESAAKGKESLVDRLKAAMRATKDHWLLTDEDGRFRAAIGGVLLISDEETQERIKKELLILRTLSAAIEGIPVNMGALQLEPGDAIGLMKLWKEIKAET